MPNSRFEKRSSKPSVSTNCKSQRKTVVLIFLLNFDSREKSTKTTPVAPGKGEKPKSPGGKKSPKPAGAAAKKASPGGQLSAADTHIEKPTGVKTRDQIVDETKYLGRKNKRISFSS